MHNKRCGNREREAGHCPPHFPLVGWREQGDSKARRSEEVSAAPAVLGSGLRGSELMAAQGQDLFGSAWNTCTRGWHAAPTRGQMQMNIT